MDVPSPAAGKVRELRVKAGDRVSEGSVARAVLEATTGDGAAKIAAAPPAAAPPPARPAPAPAPAPAAARAPAAPAPSAPTAAAAPRPPPAEPGRAAPLEVKVPPIGDFKDVPIIDVL